MRRGRYILNPFKIIPRQLILPVLCCIQFTYGIAQEERFLLISPGIQSAAVRDYGFSPLIYTGPGAYVAIEYSRTGLLNSNRIALSASTSSLRNKWDKMMLVYTANIQTYRFYHKERPLTRSLHWGWSNKNEISMRDSEVTDNFNFRSDYFTSFGGAVRYRIPFQLLSKSIMFETMGHLQLLGFKLSSSYVDNGLKGFEEELNSVFGNILHSVELFYPGNSWNFGVWPSLNYSFSTGNRMGISYRYDYSSLKNAHLSENSRGNWIISLMFTL